jgi:uncharacterized protein with NRDE domain
MCVASIAWKAHPRWSILLAGNRDELHERPAAPLARWNAAGIIAGRDLRSGGTWLGVSEDGRLAVITNLTGYTPRPTAPTRGALVTDALAGEFPTADALAAFNPFNLIVATRDVLEMVSNRPSASRSALNVGIHGLSNGAVDSDWPKVTRLNALLADWLGGDASNPALLFDALAEDRAKSVATAPDAESEPRARIFIRNPVYGTRCSTVVAIDREGAGVILERRYDADATVTGETREAFVWAGG